MANVFKTPYEKIHLMFSAINSHYIMFEMFNLSNKIK